MVWAIEFRKKAEKEFASLDWKHQKRIRDYLRNRVQSNPYAHGKALKGGGAVWRYRVGDYRLLCDLQADRCVVLVIKIGHRRDVYKHLTSKIP